VTLASLKIVAELQADSGLDPQCVLDTDEHPGPFTLSGYDEKTERTLALGPAAADQAVTFTAAAGLIMVSDEPFSLRLAAGETLLTDLRAFVLWSDSVANAVHETSVLLTGNGQHTAAVQMKLIEREP